MFKRISMLLLVALLLAGCQMPGMSSQASGSGQSELTISWAASASRTILPSNYPTPSSYTVVMTPSSGTAVIKAGLTGSSLAISDLSPDLYSIAVTGLDSGGNTLVTGSVSGVDTTTNAAQTASVTLKYITSGTGTGGISLALDLSAAPETVSSVSLVVTDPSNVVSAATLGSDYSYVNAAAAVGSWNFFYPVTTATKTTKKMETVVVAQGTTTSATVSFTSDDYKASYVAVSGVSVTGVKAVDVGSSTTLTATASPAGASFTDVYWSSSDKSIAAVDSSGVVTGVAFGSVTITATAVDGGAQGTISVAVVSGARWAKSVSSGTVSSYFNGVASDSSGNVYAAGYVYGTETLNFGNSVTATGISSTYTCVLVKYDSSGVAQWARTASTGSSYSVFNGVCVDSSGSVYAAGYMAGAAQYGFGDSVTATGKAASWNALLVKYDSSGAAQWAQTPSVGPSLSWFISVTADSSDNIYAAGKVSGTSQYTFGSSVTAKASGTSENAVVVKYNSSGTALLAKSTSSGTSQSCYRAVSVDGSGNIYASGYIFGTGTFGFGNSVTATGKNSGANVLVVKYNSSMIAQWAKTVSAGNSYSYYFAMAVDSSGNVYAAGYMDNTYTYNFGNSVTAQGPSSGCNAILVKYGSSGETQWAKTVSSGDRDSEFDGLCVDGSGNLYAAGHTAGDTETFDFGNSVTATGPSTGYNMALVKYDSNGLAQGIHAITGTSATKLNAVCVNGSGAVYVAGAIYGTASCDFGNSMTAQGVMSTDASALTVAY